MDQNKIGKFIAEMRKEQNLTQIDLAEQLGISNKTISKWECGNGMPDYSVMETLCEILKININELLSGERLPSKEYNKKAEENMMSLMQESSEIYKRERRDILLTSIGIGALLFFVQAAIFMAGGFSAFTNFIDLPTFTYVLLGSGISLAVAGCFKDFWKAFSIALRKTTVVNVIQIQKSALAVKTAILCINIVGLLLFVIGLICSYRAWWSYAEEPEVELLSVWIAVSLLSVVYALVFTLILLPIYARLKAKLIEE